MFKFGSPKVQSVSKSEVVENRANPILHAPNLNHLIKVHLLDESTKLLQINEGCTISTVLVQLKLKLDIPDISNFGLFLVENGEIQRRLELFEKVSSFPSHTIKSEDSSTTYILFKSWSMDLNGVFYSHVFQDSLRTKEATTELWLAYIEATHFVYKSHHTILSEEEAIMLGCLKLQVSCCLCLC